MLATIVWTLILILPPYGGSASTSGRAMVVVDNIRTQADCERAGQRFARLARGGGAAGYMCVSMDRVGM